MMPRPYFSQVFHRPGKCPLFHPPNAWPRMTPIFSVFIILCSALTVTCGLLAAYSHLTSKESLALRAMRVGGTTLVLLFLFMWFRFLGDRVCRDEVRVVQDLNLCPDDEHRLVVEGKWMKCLCPSK